MLIDRRPEFRFFIPGKAVSFRNRSASANAYRQRVAAAGRRLIRRPRGGPVEIRLNYFYRGDRRPDVDNIAKLVLDALSGVAYGDDRSVTISLNEAHNVDDVIRLNADTLDIVKPLAQHPEYLFVRLRYRRAAARRRRVR